MSSYLDEIAWNSDGLAPVVAQEATTGKLLMMAWVNREALETAVDEGRAVYWSRSRNKLWRKGEESGNVQKLVDIYLDCDNDAILYSVEQVGGIACHTGRVSCYYKRLTEAGWTINDPVLKDPGEMYK